MHKTLEGDFYKETFRPTNAAGVNETAPLSVKFRDGVRLFVLLAPT